METIKNIENGRLYTINASEDNSNKQWNAHPAFKGVYLKHLITGAETQGQFSAHIVKVEPNCVLDTHIHAGKTEIHEVIVGTADCLIDTKRVAYKPGDIAIIPNDTVHKVVAGEGGLYLMAKFYPALL